MKRTIIIAEAGVNHNGELEKALQLVDIAATAGADYVKFQTFVAEDLVVPQAGMAQYQIENLGKNVSQSEMLKSLELSHKDHGVLMDRCQKKGIRFFSTAFDQKSVEFLKTLKLGAWKIPSGEITNLPFLESIARCNEMTFLSTGMSSFEEVEAAVKVLLDAGLSREKLTVLHCNSEYPSPFSDVNLRAMAEMGQRLNIAFGYSDHTLGIEVSLAAVALGASVIEKHFTIDTRLPGPDHKASLNPAELNSLVKGIRHIEESLGKSEKLPSPSELKNRETIRKSIVASCEIPMGSAFSLENLVMKRPGSGLSPMRLRALLGKKASKNYRPNDLITKEELK